MVASSLVFELKNFSFGFAYQVVHEMKGIVSDKIAEKIHSFSFCCAFYF